MSALLRNFVAGRYVDAADGATSPVVDPSTGEAYAQAPVSGAADVDGALRAAHGALRFTIDPDLRIVSSS
ncbi:MAG TPA: hypothetical protein VJT31_24085 [Rugosimonospora sp.]|nr:hypothetical protein [Rugosimonospora sp.]